MIYSFAFPDVYVTSKRTVSAVLSQPAVSGAVEFLRPDKTSKSYREPSANGGHEKGQYVIYTFASKNNNVG